MAENESSRNSQSINYFRGLPVPPPPRFKEKNIQDAMDHIPFDGDIILASYPKTGTTWLQYIVLQILSKAEFFPSMSDATYKVCPYLELTGIAPLHAMKQPRIYKHHLPYNMVQKKGKSKCIYIYRNPEDTFVSYYHFLQNMQEEKINLDQYFEDFITGNIAYGLYFEHVLSFYKYKKEPNILLVSYEKLLADRKREILRIAKFLGEEYFQCLQDDQSILDKIIKQTSFDHMKKNLFLTRPTSERGEIATGKEKTINFFRKGIAGDGKCILSVDQQHRLKDLTLEKMKGTEIMKEWINE